MALPPIVIATVQNAVLSATSNMVAQAITAYRSNTPLIIDWVPVFQFVLFTLVNTPPNFAWQSFLEDTFPAYHAAPTQDALRSAARNDEKALDRAAAGGQLVEPRLSKRNTAIKFTLDQTLGAAFNTLMFSFFVRGLQAAMAGVPRKGAGDLSFLLHLGAVDAAAVDWSAVAAEARAEFWPIVVAGSKFWPFVSLLNFTVIKSVEARNLVGSLAGVAWGVYMSLVVGA